MTTFTTWAVGRPSGSAGRHRSSPVTLTRNWRPASTTSASVPVAARTSTRRDLSLPKLGSKLVRAPEEGPWAPGYYLLSFRDPPGARSRVPGARPGELRPARPDVDLRRPARPSRSGAHGDFRAVRGPADSAGRFLHAGVVIAAMDSACGYAALSLMEPDFRVLTVELKVNLLSVASGERLLARGQVMRPGRTLTVCRGTLMPWQARRNATWRRSLRRCSGSATRSSPRASRAPPR